MTAPASPGLVTDTLIMTRRGFAHWARRPGAVATELIFPVMMLVMFVYFLGGGLAVEGGDYEDFLVPGILALTMAFGLEGTMVALTQDVERGLLDRFRSLPIVPSSFLVARSVIDMISSAASLLVMLVAGLLVGWRWHEGPVSALAAVGLLLLLRLAMLWAGIWLGLLAGRPELVQTIQILVWPVAFLSSVFTSPSTMPGWLGAIAEWNPMSATAAAVRDLFGNPSWASDAWAADHALLLAVAWPVLLLAVFVPLALHRWARLSDH
ncbi:ABC transporter permease [Streptomyces avicenniae]|uniref:ABC transporter permease n=1 Tax=Streptomyces avicenniae TaxID=500153 RepID=UPI00069AB693|nr:ABC transporter permease [Streptomyces avicenniae]